MLTDVEKWIVGCIIGVLALIILIVVGTHLDLAYVGYFKPKYEDVERKTFEQTQSYNKGKISDLANYYEQYIKADSDDDKESIKSFVQMNFANFDRNKLDNHKLNMFLLQARGF